MAQTQILASGTTSATSTDVVLAAGAVANIIGFTTGMAEWAPYDKLFVFIDTNGADQLIQTLTSQLRGVTVQGPGTFRVVRPPLQTALGATSET